MNDKNFFLGLLICFLLSFLLGIERQYRRRFIGLRTMILVSVGSYLFVSFSFLLSGDYQVDVTRIAAQVVAGIGFLGAGVIIKDSKNNKVRGLTTAATLWCDASIGILCAGGFIKEAIVASLVVLFANIILRYINSLVNNKVEGRNILEKFAVELNIDKNNDVLGYMTTFVDKVDYLDVENYSVNDNLLNINVLVRKSDVLKFDKFINKVVTEHKINNYTVKKISESRLDDSDEL